MKKNAWMIILAFVFSVGSGQSNLWAGPPSKEIRYQKKSVTEGLTAAEHLALADRFDERATAQEKEIAFHEDMMTNYEYKITVHPKRGVTSERMETHCRLIIKSLEKLKTEYKELANLHREMAQKITAGE